MIGPRQLARTTAAFVLDYLRWTQVVPMLFAWIFLLAMVAALLLTNFQEQSFALIERAIMAWERWFGPIDTGSPPAEPVADAGGDGTGAVRFGDENLMPLILRGWALLALAGWVLGMARELLFGPRRRWSLRAKLWMAGVPAAICSGLMLAAWSFGGSTFHGPFLGWLAMFLGLPLAVWLVSAWSLSLGHVLDIAIQRLHGGGSVALGSQADPEEP
ncbi:MAG: hypothetical protein R3323_10715 [Wenzhouxiangellaceae bacterium]|nr:hypothetical protein [Wenzhouxiangellaceae bacterium]